MDKLINSNIERQNILNNRFAIELLTESQKAKILRSKMLDIVIDTIHQRTGGNTKYINQRDTDYLTSAIKESIYRRRYRGC
jgi:hypothetical protein